MKNRLLLILAFFLTTSHLVAEEKPIKLGCVNLHYILEHTPEYRQIEVDVKAFELQNKNQLEKKYLVLQEKAKEIQQGAATMTEDVKRKKYAEFQQLQMELEAFQNEQQDALAKKQMGLIQPILEKIQKVIALLAKENKYTHVINTENMLSLFSNVLYLEPEYDLSNLVFKKLGIDPAKLIAAAAEKKEAINAKAATTASKTQESSKSKK